MPSVMFVLELLFSSFGLLAEVKMNENGII